MTDDDWRVYTIQLIYKGYLSSIISPILSEEPIYQPASIDAVMSIITINLDLFGFIYVGGSNSSLNAVSYIREYLGRVDYRYREVGGLLYHMLRHGYVHRFSSKRLMLSDGKILDFEFSFSKKRDEHLVIKKGATNEPRLLINVPLICEDTLLALDLYAEDVHSDPNLANTFERGFNTRREPERESQLRRRNYILDSDFDFVHRQLN
ncbi:hypothetical protein ACFLYR_02055 [Chloroflexota bacterium]